MSPVSHSGLLLGPSVLTFSFQFIWTLLKSNNIRKLEDSRTFTISLATCFKFTSYLTHVLSRFRICCQVVFLVTPARYVYPENTVPIV
jgi:hypothetical protein